MNNTGTEFCILFLNHSERCYPNPTDLDVTNTNGMNEFSLLLSFYISSSHNSILGFLWDIILFFLSACRSVGADFISGSKARRMAQTRQIRVQNYLFILTGLEVARDPIQAKEGPIKVLGGMMVKFLCNCEDLSVELPAATSLPQGKGPSEGKVSQEMERLGSW